MPEARTPHFSSTEEAEQWATQHLCQYAFLHDMPLPLAERWITTLSRLDRGRGLLKNALLASHATFAANEGKPDYRQIMTTWSSPETGVDGISFHGTLFQSEQRLLDVLRHNREAGQSTIEDVDGLFTHEFGHVLERSQKDGGQALRSQVRTETEQRVNQGLLTYDDWLAAAGHMVFGEKSGDFLPSEAIAEGYRLSRQNRLPEVLDYLRDIFKEFGVQ